MVVVIMGILAGLIAPSIKKTYDNLAFNSFVKDLYYVARYLQASAVSQKKAYRLDINSNERTFQIKVKKNNEYAAVAGRFKKIFRAPLGVTMFTKPSGTKAVYFYPDGSMDQATFVFKNQDENTVSLVLQGASGVIKVQ